jgi:hypothetical protein
MLKWFIFIYFVFINEFEESKYLNGVQNFILNYSFIWVMKTFKQKVLSLKSLFKRIFLLSSFIQKGLQKFIKSLPNWIQIPAVIYFPSHCCHQGISVPRMTTEQRSYLVLVAHLSSSIPCRSPSISFWSTPSTKVLLLMCQCHTFMRSTEDAPTHISSPYI